MKRTSLFFILAFALLLVSCKDSGKNTTVEGPSVSITHDQGTTEVPLNPKRVVVLAFNSLENLDLIDAPVVGIPKQAVPKHLEKYASDPEIVNVGSLMEVNLEAINELRPDLIIAGYRLAESYPALSRIAPTIFASVDDEDPMGALRRDLENLGKIFEREAEFEKAYADLEAKVAATRARIAETEVEALVVLHNKGRFSAYGSGSRFGLIHDQLGIKEAAEGLETHRHGTRTSSEFIQKTDPDILFIVDRSSAIGELALDRNEIENELIQRTKAFQNGKVVYLDPQAWYLSGNGGLMSMNIMVDEVAEVF